MKERKLSDLKEIMRNLPRLEDDGDAFARDIAQAIAVQPPVREGQSMGIIFDTSTIIAIERGHKSLDAFISGREEEPFGISVVTAAELLHGIERADTEERKLRRQAFVEN